ncbi:AAA family ATPase [Nocardioides daejeonensis]|uniref:AAA family ATPase n=1 Tax=Nocardioides daejeonensis TaxID=1046556 RepID=UPI000D747DD6|nr:AAA family ATPase [Nocardioides daejeonensis]
MNNYEVLPRYQRPRLLRMTISNFRGFNRPVTLDFDASAVLLHGPNGSGKTSIFDAVQWLLTDDLPRLGTYRLRKADLYLTNAFGGTRPASVEATLETATGIVRVTRQGDGRSSVLELERDEVRLEGPAAYQDLQGLLAPGPLALEEVLHTSGLLQQDDLRQLLQTKPDERYRQLMRLLGLDALDQVERVVQARRNLTRDDVKRATADLESATRQRDSLAEQLETARAQVDRAVETSDLHSLTTALCAQYPGTLVPAAADASWNERLLTAEIARFRNLEVQLRAEISGLAGSILDAAEGEVAAAESLLAEAEAAFQNASHLASSAEQTRDRVLATSDALARLSASAIPFLSHTEESVPCPVCETLVDPRVVRSGLEARAANSAALADADTAVLFSTNHRDAASEKLAAARRRLAEARQQASKKARDLASVEKLQAEAAALWKAQLVRPAAAGNVRRVNGRSSAAEYETALNDLRSVLELVTHLQPVCTALDAAVEEFARHQASNRLVAERANAIPRLEESLSAASLRVEQARSASERARRAATASVTLHEATKSANEDIFRRRFAALEPLMNDVYARLDPHPAFTNLSFTVESFRSRGTATATVTDADRNVSVNPMLIFSSAQANIVVLSAFLALGWAAGPNGLPFVLLDDPLQAMDDVNVLGFADLARHLRRDRQLVLGTHDARFAGLLERKLAGRAVGEDLIVHEFVGWSRSGPEIESRTVPIVLDQARRILSA